MAPLSVVGYGGSGDSRTPQQLFLKQAHARRTSGAEKGHRRKHNSMHPQPLGVLRRGQLGKAPFRGRLNRAGLDAKSSEIDSVVPP